ncbi:MAG TPA: PHB depolymerase family esterase [Thermoleophilaceae bacterium]
MTSAGQHRVARVHVPRAPRGTRLPLVVAFHGAGATGQFMENYSGLSGLADQKRFVVAYPSAGGSHPFWSLNETYPNGREDVRFVSDLIDTLRKRLCVDSNRVYATGVSNGGGFTARIGCGLSERFAAIAPVGGGYRAIPDCDADRPLSVLEIHGTSDNAVPYFGKPPDYRGSVPAYVQGWRQRDACAPSTAARRLAYATVLVAWSKCKAGTQVAQIKRYGRGHEWPGAFGAPGFSATAAVWDFFKDKVRAR